MEHLRHVAGARGADPAAVAAETVAALAHICHDPAALVVTARRMVEHQPSAAQLWWACARVLTAVDPCAEARTVGRMLFDDDTADLLDDAFDVGDPAGEPALAVAWAVGPDEALTSAEEAFEIASAAADGRDRWLIAPRGTRLPEPLWQEVVGAARRDAASSRTMRVETLDRSVFTHLACPDGAGTMASMSRLWSPECAHAPELLRRSVM
jgi:hypothetical protein